MGAGAAGRSHGAGVRDALQPLSLSKAYASGFRRARGVLVTSPTYSAALLGSWMIRLYTDVLVSSLLSTSCPIFTWMTCLPTESDGRRKKYPVPMTAIRWSSPAVTGSLNLFPGGKATVKIG